MTTLTVTPAAAAADANANAKAARAELVGAIQTAARAARQQERMDGRIGNTGEDARRLGKLLLAAVNAASELAEAQELADAAAAFAALVNGEASS